MLELFLLVILKTFIPPLLVA